MEIKWSSTRKRFSHHSQFQRLAQQYKRKLKTPLTPMPVPPGWTPHLQGWEHSGFRWEKNADRGYGLLLSRREGQHTVLVQFFAEPPRFERLVETVLASLRYCRDGEPLEWQLFDIRATTPADFQLTQHRFDAGAFRLVFQKKKRAHLTLNRWGPADIIPDRKRIEEFASRIYGISAAEGQYRACVKHAHCVDWVSRYNHRGGGWAFFGRVRIMRFCVWSLPEKNRLMAASIHSKTGVSDEWFEKICDNYAAI